MLIFDPADPTVVSGMVVVPSCVDLMKLDMKLDIDGLIEDVIIDDKIARGIQDTEEAKKWIQEALDDKGDKVSLDSETSGLYPRNGHVLGLSMCYDGKHGVYTDAESLD